jgi:hypothetical protein
MRPTAFITVAVAQSYDSDVASLVGAHGANVEGVHRLASDEAAVRCPV